MTGFRLSVSGTCANDADPATVWTKSVSVGAPVLIHALLALYLRFASLS